MPHFGSTSNASSYGNSSVPFSLCRRRSLSCSEKHHVPFANFLREERLGPRHLHRDQHQPLTYRPKNVRMTLTAIQHFEDFTDHDTAL